MDVNTTIWRDHPQGGPTYATVVNPSVVFECNVNQTTFTYPIAELTYDGATGTYTDVEQHQTAVVYSSGGDFKGMIRVRKALTSNTFYLGETAQGDIYFENNDHIEVLNDYRLWSIPPRATVSGTTVTYYKDYDIAYSDQGENFPPMANAGPYFAGNVEPDLGYAAVWFDATDSFALANGESIASYAWEFGGDDIANGGTTGSTTFANYPPGVRWVRLTVTDTGGNTGVAVACVVICDPADPDHAPTPVTLDSLTGTLDTGWELTGQVVRESLGDHPKGALIMVWSELTYGGTRNDPISFTTQNREHMRFIGWITDINDRVDPVDDQVTFVALNIQGMLQRVPDFPQTVEYNALPDRWVEVYNLTAWLSMWYLWHWHSTLSLIADIFEPNYAGNYHATASDIVEAPTLYDQVKGEAGAAHAVAAADHLGRMFFDKEPLTMNTAERAALDTAVHLQDGDMLSATLQRRDHPPIKWFRGDAVQSSWSVATGLMCIAPGDAPAQGVAVPSYTKKWAADQSDLNERAGHYFAWKNSDDPALVIELAHQGTAIDPAWLQWIEVTLSSDYNRIGRDYDQTRFVLREISITFDAESGTELQTITLERETEGVSATTIDPVTGEWSDQTWTPGDTGTEFYSPPDPEGGGELGTGTGKGLIGLRTKTTGAGNFINSFIGYTSNLSASGGPTWTAVHSGLPAGTETGTVAECTGINLDPYNPDTAICIIRDHGIYINEDWKNGGAWSEIIGQTALVAALNSEFGSVTNFLLTDMALTPAEAGLIYVMCATFAVNGPYCVLRIEDYDGDTLDISPELEHAAGYYQSGIFRPVIMAGNQDGDKIFVTGVKGFEYGLLSQRHASVWRSTWNSFSPMSSGKWESQWTINQTAGSGYVQTAIFNPYTQADGDTNDDTELYLVAESAIYRSTDAGYNFSSWSSVAPVIESANREGGASIYGATRDTFEIMAITGQLAMAIQDSKSAVIDDPLQVAVSSPTGWTSNGIDSYQGKVGWVGGWPTAAGQFYVGLNRWGNIASSNNDMWSSPDPLLQFTQDSGSTWSDWTGNLWTLLTALSQGSAGVVRFTPHWTE